MSGWLDGLTTGDRAALARAITAVENDADEARAVYAAIHPRLGHAHVVGFTGPPGAGKSTLVSAYVGELRRRGLSVGVVAVDPSSPFSGGAILGDRIRMAGHTGDDGVFVRSLASRGHLGGLSHSAARVVDVMDAAGKDVVVVETVGAGQSEVEVAEVANTKVVVCAPGLGDDVQAIKAGILEIADILVVNKADLPAAARTAEQLRAMLGLSRHAGWTPPVLSTTATAAEGIAGITELADAIERHREAGGASRAQRAAPRQRMRRLLAAGAAERLQHRLRDTADPTLDDICDRLLRGEIGFDEAADLALDTLPRRPPREG